MLTARQLSELSLPQTGKASKQPEGVECVWRNSNIPYGYRISITFLNIGSVKPGLSGVYAARKNYDDFEEIPTVNGFPGVIANPLKTDRTSGNCAIEIGLSDQQSLDIGIQIDFKNPNYTNACAVTEEVAKALAATARQRGG